MEYKTIQELYLALGVAGVIIVVFLALFIWLVTANNKKTVEHIEQIVEKMSSLQKNDTEFEQLMKSLIEAVKELSTTNKIVAETVNKLDFYNKDLHNKLDKHDTKADKIYAEMLKK